MSNKTKPKIDKYRNNVRVTKGFYWDNASIAFDKHEKGYSKNVKGFLKRE